MNAGNFCNREVIVCDRDDSILDAAKKMRRFHVGDLIVIEEQKGQRIPVGILTDRDIVVEILAEELDLDQITVGDSMSFELSLVHEDDEITETVKMMRSKGIRRLPVVNSQGGLQGIITVDNIIDLMAQQLTDLSQLVSKQHIKEQQKCSTTD